MSCMFNGLFMDFINICFGEVNWDELEDYYNEKEEV